MKIVIVENPRPLTVEHYNDVANAPLSASLNSGYALAVARQAGWETAYLDFTAAGGDGTLMAELILAEDGDLILLHWIYSWGHEDTVCTFCKMLKKQCHSPIGAFGLFPTLSHQRLMKYAPSLDFILVGEFEETLDELLRHYREKRSLEALAGVALRANHFVPRPLMIDLARLPPPDDVGANLSYGSLNIAASRGCHGSCSFCFINRYYGCNQRRVRNNASLEQELATRLARNDISSLYFVDPTFIGHGSGEHERVVAISRLAKGYRLPFGFETRVDSVDEELMSVLADNGASSVFLGIESGCNAVLQRINKRITREQICRAVHIIKENGIRLSIGFIMFEPDATMAELYENYAFLDELNLLYDHELTANLLYHNQIVLNGSTAWERYEREGRLLLDARLPFEARYRFRDERVGLVCSAMGQLSTEYFRGTDALRRTVTSGEQLCCSLFHGDPADCSNSEDINSLLKEAFLAFCSAADSPVSQDIIRIESIYRLQLKKMLAVQATS